MLFNSLKFLIYFPIVAAGYFLLPRKLKNPWLLVSSYYFYMSWNAKYALLILFSTIVTWGCARFMGGSAAAGASDVGDETGGSLIAGNSAAGSQDSGGVSDVGGGTAENTAISNAAGKSTQGHGRKFWLVLCLVLNLAILAYFKYFNFMADNVNLLMEHIGLGLTVPAIDVLLPVGISFYTFQALGYTIDVYRGNVEAEGNFFKYALFVSFFPQLVAGPIERSGNLLHQFDEPKRFDVRRMEEGLLIMLWGFFMKLVIADRAAIFIDAVFSDTEYYGGFYLIVASVLFAFQIYCDFAGYSTIALGVGRIMGFRLTDNFNAPYLSASIKEFWNRWHITLSGWFKDYVYIPLGGNRRGRLRTDLNLMAVFLLSGLWHGANWTFVIWGGLNGLYQIIGQALKPFRDKAFGALCMGSDSRLRRALAVIVTFVLADISWVFFRAQTVAGAFGALSSIFTARNTEIFTDGSIFMLGLDKANFILLIMAAALLAFADVFKYRGVVIRDRLMRLGWLLRWLVIIGGVLAVLIFGVWGYGYDAAAFIYFQF